MDISLNEEQTIFQDNIRRWAEKKLKPVAKEMDEKEIFGFDLLRELGELGYLGVIHPQEYGGMGAEALMGVILVEELTKYSPGFATTVMVSTLNGPLPIVKIASEEQKQKYLPPVFRGEKVLGCGITEPNVGSDTASIETRAVRNGDYYVINGTKMFLTNGCVADYVWISAVTHPGRKHKGISLIMVDKGTPGVTYKKLDKLGWRCSDTGELAFQDCRVPISNLVGEDGLGFYSVMTVFTVGRIFVATLGLGSAERCFDEALNYAKVRHQFGQPIGKFQAVSHKLADMYMEIEASRQLIYNAAYLHEKYGESNKQFQTVAAAAKLFASETANRTALKALQIFGGYGFMMEYPIQMFYRDAPILTIGEGTSDIQRRIIAKNLGL